MIFKARRTYKNGVDYDKDIDYSKEMEKAALAGDMARLAKLEEERNKKIDGEKMTDVSKTYNYIDLGTKIEAGIRDGASPYEIKDLYNKRRDKATHNEQYDAYKNDEIQKNALKYYYDNVSGAGEDYKNRPVWEDSYGDEIRSLLNRVSKEKEFKYDPEEDEVYKNLKNQMQNESRRAMTDVLADVQSSSGGKNSYAVSAAMQAANNYNAKLAEELPKLYEIAYKRYTDQRENDYKALESTLEASKKEHDEYLDAMEQYNKDRNFARDSYEADLDRAFKEDERSAEEKRDARDFEYKVKKDENDTRLKTVEAARKLVLHYEESGIEASPELLKIAEMEDYSGLNSQSAEKFRLENELAAALKNSQIANNAAKTSKAYSDMSNSAARLNLDSQKHQLNVKKYEKENGSSSKGGGADVSGVTNKKGNGGYYIGNQFFSEDKIKSGLSTGSFVKKKNPDGTYTIEKKQ